MCGLPCGSVGKESTCNVGDWVWSQGWEDPLEKGKATHSSILAWRIPWTVQSKESQRVRHYWATFTFTFMCETKKKERNNLLVWPDMDNCQNSDKQVYKILSKTSGSLPFII